MALFLPLGENQSWSTVDLAGFVDLLRVPLNYISSCTEEKMQPTQKHLLHLACLSQYRQPI